jgi:hypothetical protein
MISWKSKKIFLTLRTRKGKTNSLQSSKDTEPWLDDRFSFCDYPFMLNPAVKADVLKVESVFQMRHELQDAFFRALFQGILLGQCIYVIIISSL